METLKISGQTIIVRRFNTVIVGAGAAGMNCARRLHELMTQKGVADANKRVAVVTAGLKLGASRMSGSDKQTYYKLGTSPGVADSAESFAASLTAGGCCHGDLALAEGIGSLRGFYNLVEAGVPFPSDAMGSYIGYKTDHDPYERATSAGPKTSMFMCECLERIVRGYDVEIFDRHESIELLAGGRGGRRRVTGLVTMQKGEISGKNLALHLFLAENFVLAAGGPGGLYETSVYPHGQTGMHGMAFRAGLAAENLTESQFGLASIKFRWNVSGTYMQAIPRIFSANAAGGDEREFLADYFPTMGRMATNIFLKGYQWPFDPQRIANLRSSLIDVLVWNENRMGRRVFMDFRRNPVGKAGMSRFRIGYLEPEARDYLEAAGALQKLPIARLAHMNRPAIDIYREHGIDLRSEPLEIAVCAQHNNGGFAVNKWWESSVRRAFVIGEMAGSHGVKRPGGAALNAGQVGAQRAAEFIVNAYGCGVAGAALGSAELLGQVKRVVERLARMKSPYAEMTPAEALARIRQRMTASGGHIRASASARIALRQAAADYRHIAGAGMKIGSPKDMVEAVRAEHLALASVAYLKAIVELLRAGGGSRGSYLVLSDRGIVAHPLVRDPDTGAPLRYKPENKVLRKTILRVDMAPMAEDMFVCRHVPVRPMPGDRKAFEPAWAEYRGGKIYTRRST